MLAAWLFHTFLTVLVDFAALTSVAWCALTFWCRS